MVGSAVTGGARRDLAVSPHTGRIHLNVVSHHYGAGRATLSAYDAATLDPLELGEPRATNANIGAASGFMLDVGFAPGRTDLSLFLGPDPFARFSSVPPGTYYVRLRGGNEVGGGRPTDEVVLRIP